MQEYEKKLEDLSDPTKLQKTEIVFLTFRNTSTRDQFLQKYRSTESMIFSRNDENGIKCTNSSNEIMVIKVKTPPKVEEIKWENIGHSRWEIFKKRVRIWIYCSGLILLCFILNGLISFGVFYAIMIFYT